MIEVKSSYRSTLEQLNSQIKALQIKAGEYMRITTPLPNFSPIYLYTIQSLIYPSTKQSLQNVQEQPILKYGSQLYLKTQPITNFVHHVQLLKNHSLTQYPTIFFEIMMNGQYLTKKENNSIQLIQENTKQGFWAIYQTSVYDDSYLSMGDNGWEIHKNYNENCCFEITHSSQDNFILIPQKCPASIFQPIRIRLLPVQNSIINLFFELKYSQQILRTKASSKRISQIIQQLIYFNIPQFGHNQKLLSSPIQKIVLEVGISKLIVQFLCRQIQEKSYRVEIANVISNDVKLICQDNQENSLLFNKLINVILFSEQYNLYLDSLIELVHENCYFINSFQSQGWSKIMLRKLQQLSVCNEIKEFETFNKLMLLISEFCNKDYSIANKYLIMHTFEQMQNTNDKRKQQNQDSEEQIWLRYFHEGQFVFVEVQNEGSSVEIELETFLEKDVRNRLRYIGQIGMVGKLCSSFNINAINKYNQVLKYISSYCYNENYPYFKDGGCRDKTLEAICACFDWTKDDKIYDNWFNISLVFNMNEADMESGRDRNNAKNRNDNFKNLRSNLNKGYQTFTDILKNLVNAFQKQVQKYLIRMEKRQAEILDIFMLDNKQFAGRLLNWIKIIEISLSARLITILKHKTGPYAQYFKKIFENNSNFKQKQANVKKQMKPKNNLLVPDGEYHTQIYYILNFLIKLIRYNPIYSMYLREMKIRKDVKNKDKLIEKVFNSRKSNTMSNKLKDRGVQKIEVNKIVCMYQLITDESEKKQMKQINVTKFYCYKALALIYQNIIEEQIQYQVQNLGSILKYSKLVNNLDLEEGLKKFTFTDEPFRLSLIQNWYLISNPQILDSATTCLKYIYNQQQIYIRSLNNTLLLFSKNNMQFYKSISNYMDEVIKLSLCIENWFFPQILFSQQVYYDNYILLQRSLQGVNNQIKKLNILNIHDLEDYQDILQKMGILECALNILNHLKMFLDKNKKSVKKGNSESTNIKKQSLSIINELIKILQFYVHFNEGNKTKSLIVLGQVMTENASTFQFFIFMLKQSKDLQKYINLLNQTVLCNIISNITENRQFLQLILITNNASFIRAINRLSIILVQHSSDEHKDVQQCIISDNYCFHLFCKVMYRIISIGGFGYLFMDWFYNVLFYEYLQKQVNGNIHFKTKIIESLQNQLIQLSCSVSYLIFWIYKNQHEHKSKMIGKQNKKSSKLKSIQGIRMISNYIVIQLLASVLQTNSTLLKIYIEYYLHDLIPLLQFCDHNFLSAETNKIICERAENYLNLYEQGTGLVKSHSLNIDSPIPKMAKKGSFNVEIDHKNFKYEQLTKQKKMKEIRNYLMYRTVPINFFPRCKSLLPPNRPQVSRQQKNINFPQQKQQKQDEFTKISKKAMKMWYKSRHKLNQKRGTLGNSRFMQDINRLSSQYDMQQKQNELIINSVDVICKCISIIVHNNYIKISPQNQIFIFKNVIVWLHFKISQKRKMKNGEDSAYLIKKFEYSTVIIQVLEQLLSSVQVCNKNKNVFLMCYQLKFVQMLASTMPSNLSNSLVSSITSLIVKITYPLTKLYHLHKQLLSQYELSKSEQRCEFIQKWIPLRLLIDFVLQFVSVVGVAVQQWNELCYVFLQNSVLVQRSDKVGFDDILDTFRNANNERYDNVRNKLVKQSDIFQSMELLF